MHFLEHYYNAMAALNKSIEGEIQHVINCVPERVAAVKKTFLFFFFKDVLKACLLIKAGYVNQQNHMYTGYLFLGNLIYFSQMTETREGKSGAICVKEIIFYGEEVSEFILFRNTWT